MKNFFLVFTTILLIHCSPQKQKEQKDQVPPAPKNVISIRGENFLINGILTLQGVMWDKINMEGLLPNSRMVQGIFDDMNPETVER